MYKHKTYLAIIPARGGSKRLPNKNIRALNGKPLIAYSIEAALKCKLIDEVVVTTDSEEIASIAREYNAKVPFLRPSKLASDTSTTLDAVIHAIEFYKNVQRKEFDFVIVLQPTSPFRNNKHIDEAICLCEKKNANSVTSVCEVEHSPLWANTLDESFSMDTFIKNEFKNKRSQDLEKYYRLNGAIYLCNVNKLVKTNSFMQAASSYAYLMDNEDSIDIDTQLDFSFAELIINQGKK